MGKKQKSKKKNPPKKRKSPPKKRKNPPKKRKNPPKKKKNPPKNPKNSSKKKKNLPKRPVPKNDLDTRHRVLPIIFYLFCTILEIGSAVAFFFGFNRACELDLLMLKIVFMLLHFYLLPAIAVPDLFFILLAMCMRTMGLDSTAAMFNFLAIPLLLIAGVAPILYLVTGISCGTNYLICMGISGGALILSTILHLVIGIYLVKKLPKSEGVYPPGYQRKRKGSKYGKEKNGKTKGKNKDKKRRKKNRKGKKSDKKRNTKSNKKKNRKSDKPKNKKGKRKNR